MAKRIGGRPEKKRLLPGIGYPIPITPAAEPEPPLDSYSRSHAPRSAGVFRKTHAAWERRNYPNYREILYPPDAGGGDTDIVATLATGAFATFAATVDRGSTTTATRPTITSSTFAATIRLNVSVTATRATATFSTFAAAAGVSNDIAATLATGAFQTFAAAVSGGVTPEELATVKAAGRPRRRRRYYVEIDGETFLVDDERQAAALLEKAAALAEKAAGQAAAQIVSRETPRIRTLGAVPQVTLKPTIRTNVNDEAVRLARARINAIYREAAQRAELQLLMLRAEADDESDIEELMLMGDL